jgi:hypothetical protein
MTITDYLLIGVASAAVIYTVYRLFLGWRNSPFPQRESEKSRKRNAASTRRWSSIPTDAFHERRAEKSD